MSDIGCMNPSGCAFEGFCHSSRECKNQRIMIECRHCHYKYPYTGIVYDWCPYCGKAYAALPPEVTEDVRF